MIRLQDMTPDVYYNQSRDFQFIGRLFDVLLNSTKTSTDLIGDLPLDENSDLMFSELAAMTLGLKLRHQYSSKQLQAIVAVLSDILRNKGSLRAVQLAYEALISTEGLKQNMYYEAPTLENHTLTLYLPKDLSDLTLLRDLLDYIMPAGVSCRLVKMTTTDTAGSLNLELGDMTLNTYEADKLTISKEKPTTTTPRLVNANNTVRNGQIGASIVRKTTEEND